MNDFAIFVDFVVLAEFEPAYLAAARAGSTTGKKDFLRKDKSPLCSVFDGDVSKEISGVSLFSTIIISLYIKERMEAEVDGE